MTLITDRVGRGLTCRDRVIFMQNDVTGDFWDLARKISRRQVDCRFRYIFVMVGLDWSLSVNKAMIKEGLKRLLYSIDKGMGGCAIGYLPMHLHFLEKGDPGQAAMFIQPLERYFDQNSEFTLAGRFVLRQMLLKAIGVIPMDGQH